MVQDEAYEFCYKLDTRARLLELHNEEQKEYLNLLLNHEGVKYYWLGGTDKGHEGHWIWENSIKPIEEFVWYQGEPNGGINSNYMLWSFNSGGAVGDVPWDYANVHPLCQIPIE